jgi:aspartate/methionine/tyrosine aminotransferase
MSPGAAMREAVRAAAVPPFHAMRMAREAADLAAAGADVLHLEVGQPSTPAPALARAAVVRALESADPLGYTNAAGLMSLRRRIARHYAEWYGVEVDADTVAVVGGASAGFTLAFASSFDPGDRVGVIEPGYPCYRNTLLALGIEPVPVPVGPDERWAPTVELLDAAGPLDGLVIASPSNPTGTVLRADRLADVVGWCAANGVQVVADEIYHGITSADPAPTALAAPGGDVAVVINSFSKYFSMTGWRLGWMVVPAHLRDAVERLQQNLYICAPHVSQVAGLAAFDCHDELRGHVARYDDHRRLLVDGLAAAGIDRIANADGAFYVYADVSHLTDDSMTLCRRWLDELHVATTPGLDFDLARGHRYVRFSCAGSADDLRRACDRLAGWRP